jgi:hypothetical protein
MTLIEAEAADIANLDLVTNPADLRRDIHVFVDYAGTHEIKRGHRDNQLPMAHRQRLARLMSDPRIAQVGENGNAPWIEHVDAVCIRLGFVRYNTEGIYAGYSSSSESFPDNYIKCEGTQYEQFLDLSLLEQEQRILDIHLKETGAVGSEFFSGGPLSRLDRFDSWGSATGVAPTIPFAKVRMFLLDLLAELPSGVWFSTQSFIEHLRQRDPWFLIPERVSAAVAARAIRSGRYSNFIERKRGDWGNRDGISDRDPEGFAKVEGRFVERFLEGIPLVMGYTDVAYSKRKKATEIEPSRGLLPAFRVTERLRSAMRGEVAAPKITVLPNFEVHVESLLFPAKIDRQLLVLGDLTQRGVVTVYRLAKAKVAAVMAADPKVGVIDHLKALTGRDLPANVEAELNEWAGHSEKFVLYEGLGLLEGRREQAGVDGFVVEAISPNFAVVRSPAGLYQHLEKTEQVPLKIQHSEHVLAAPAGVQSRVAPSAAPPRESSRKPARIRRIVQTTLCFPDAEVHAAFLKVLLSAKCVVPADSHALTVSYGKKQEPLVKECLKKLNEQCPLAVENVEQ